MDYYRWVLRALMRSVSLNFIVPSLQVTGGKINKDSASAEDTSKEGDKENKKPSGDASVPARTVLKNWLSQYRDFKFDKTQQTETQGERKLEQYLITVPFELGEFHFFVEDFAEAERLFVLASERATTYTSKYSVTEAKKWCLFFAHPHTKRPECLAHVVYVGLFHENEWKASCVRVE